MKVKKTRISAIFAILFVASMTVSMIPMVTAAYDNPTQTAINQGMHWDLNANASSIRLTMWDRYQDNVPTWVYAVISPNPVGIGQKFTMVIYNPMCPLGSS
jgi:hypothetical protein